MCVRRTCSSLPALLTPLLCILAASASAIDVVGKTSATITWNPASGPVAGYGVFVAYNGAPYPATPYFTTTRTSGQVTGAYGDSFTVKVAAYTASGAYGPFSPDSAVIQFVPLAPGIALSTTGLSAATQAGSNPQSGRILIQSSGGGALNYSITTDQTLGLRITRFRQQPIERWGRHDHGEVRDGGSCSGHLHRNDYGFRQRAHANDSGIGHRVLRHDHEPPGRLRHGLWRRALGRRSGLPVLGDEFHDPGLGWLQQLAGRDSPGGLRFVRRWPT